MKNYIIGCMGLLITCTAYAEDVTFSGDATSYCTVNVGSAGVLTVSGTSVTTESEATVNVQNNDANAYNLSITAPTDFSSSPVGFTGNVTFSLAEFDSSGANTGSNLTTLDLSNVGDDVVSVRVEGSTDSVMTAGTYQAVAVLSCNAI